MSVGKQPFVLRWGIIGAGSISSEFVKDLVLPTEGRNVMDVVHAVIAVGSRNVAKAEEFIRNFCPEGACAQKTGLVKTKPAARGSYAEVYGDTNVDIIYVGTPHISHFEDAMNALKAGKHVLVEKPATLNRAEFEELSDFAKSKKLFLMEGIWTRFFPLTYALEDVLFKEEAIGEIRRLQSDFSVDSIDIPEERKRLLDINLAGGGLLDLGSYPVTWALLLLYRHPKNGRAAPEHIRASMLKYPQTGVDLYTDWTLDFPRIGTGARACLSTSMCVNSPMEVVTRVQGTKGEIILPWVSARPERFVIRRSKIGRGPQEFTEETREFPIQGMGLNWEADAVARYIRDGKIESDRMPHEETLLELAIFDEVRRQGGYIFPEGFEKVKASA
ncbi:hypothetical protein M0805_006432 [Coniferiporia weirii]|nr:hypothetical protein M0805_006432 [Coniferiporia weirii]